MNAQSPIPSGDGRKRSGNAYSTYNWEYKYDKENSYCGVDEVIVNIHTVYTVPKITEARSSQRIIMVFEEFLVKLMIHERGHRNIAYEAAMDIDLKLQKLPPFSSCSQLESQVKKLTKNVIKRRAFRF